jgi:hypothetical protein
MILVDDISKSDVRKVTESDEIKVPEHLNDLYESSSKSLSEEERRDVI